MLHIEVLCVGRLGEPYWTAACNEYLKRLSAYAKVSVTELPENHPVVPRIPGSAYVVALCIEGTPIDSLELSAFLAERAGQGDASLCFLIGGSNGLPDAAKAKARFKLSLSKMTFPHHMARVMLLEQLYRAFQIAAGGKYHK